MVIGREVAEHPFTSVRVTEKVPEAVTVIDCVVSELFQRYSTPGVDVRTTLSPSQKVVGPSGVIVTAGSELTNTSVTAEVEEQPLASVMVTE